MTKLKLGTINGRHELPVDGCILEEITSFSIDKIEEEVKGKLLELFPTAEGRSYSPANAMDYTDIVVAFRGHLDLFVTGYTPVTTAVIKYCHQLGISLNLYHFDRDSGEYVRQEIF